MILKSFIKECEAQDGCKWNNIFHNKSNFVHNNFLFELDIFTGLFHFKKYNINKYKQDVWGLVNWSTPILIVTEDLIQHEWETFKSQATNTKKCNIFYKRNSELEYNKIIYSIFCKNNTFIEWFFRVHYKTLYITEFIILHHYFIYHLVSNNLVKETMFDVIHCTYSNLNWN